MDAESKYSGAWWPVNIDQKLPPAWCYVRRQRRVYEQLPANKVRHDHAEGHERIHRGGAVTGIDERGAVERRGAPDATGAVRIATTQPQFGNWKAGELEIRKMGTQNRRVDNAVGEAAPLRARGGVLTAAVGCAHISGGGPRRPFLRCAL